MVENINNKQGTSSFFAKLYDFFTRINPISRLDRYIIGKFLGTYFFSIALIISIAVVFDFNENIDKFLSRNAPISAILFDYYLNFIPYYSNLFSQLFVFISVIFFTTKLAENGAKIIFELSAIPELVGRRERIRTMKKAKSMGSICAIASAGAGKGESSTDFAFSGYSLIVENGIILSETKPFSDERLLIADIDTERLISERKRNKEFVSSDELFFSLSYAPLFNYLHVASIIINLTLSYVHFSKNSPIFKYLTFLIRSSFDFKLPILSTLKIKG